MSTEDASESFPCLFAATRTPITSPSLKIGSMIVAFPRRFETRSSPFEIIGEFPISFVREQTSSETSAGALPAKTSSLPIRGRRSPIRNCTPIHSYGSV